MANEIDTGVASGVLYENITQAANFVFNENALLRQIVTTYDMTNTPGLTASIPLYPKVTNSGALAAGADLSNESITPTAVDITAAEYGHMSTIQDIVVEASPLDVGADVGRVLGDALAQAMDESIVDLFASASTDIGPGAGAEVTVEHVMKGAAALRNAGVPMQGLVAVVHPHQAFNIKKTFLNAGGSFGASTDAANRVASEYFVARIGGVDIYESASMDINTDDDAVGAVFHPASIGMALKRDIRIALQRDESIRGFEVVASAAWGTGIIDGAKIVKLTGDAAL